MTALVLSFLLAPIGVVLGIVGIFHTKGGRRRGMGLAIAAIPIGCVVSLVLGVVGISGYVAWNALNTAKSSLALFRGSSVEISARAGETYERMSPRFKVGVSGERFEQWATKVLADHGSLQQITRSANLLQPSPDASGLIINLNGEFVNGPANIAVTVGFAGMSVEVDDISVEGVSPLSDY